MKSELVCKCDKCDQEFAVLVEYGLYPEEIDPEVELEAYMSVDQVWYCPACQSYNTHVNDCYDFDADKSTLKDMRRFGYHGERK
jgi:Zn finger protein HypA/HybF involved in hydrogenase expression